jgi:hypothetical protein
VEWAAKQEVPFIAKVFFRAKLEQGRKSRNITVHNDVVYRLTMMRKQEHGRKKKSHYRMEST